MASSLDTVKAWKGAGWLSPGMGSSLISGCTLRLTEWCLAHLRREVKSVKMLGWA